MCSGKCNIRELEWGKISAFWPNGMLWGRAANGASLTRTLRVYSIGVDWSVVTVVWFELHTTLRGLVLALHHTTNSWCITVKLIVWCFGTISVIVTSSWSEVRVCRRIYAGEVSRQVGDIQGKVGNPECWGRVRSGFVCFRPLFRDHKI